MRNMFKVLTVLAALVMIALLAVLPGMAEDVSVTVSVTVETDGSLPATPDTTYALRLKAEGDFPMPEGSVDGEYVLTNPGIGTVSFPEIVYEGVGDHYYTISQDPGSHDDALEYDSSSYSLRVMVVYDGDSKITTAFLRPGPDGQEKDTTCTFVNRYTERLTKTVKKVWEDDDDYDGVRPASLTVALQANGTEIDSVTLNEANDWTASISDLPATVQGEEVTYTWVEPDVEEYTLTSSETVDEVTTLTNTHEPGVLDLTIRKAWYDNDNAAGERPTRLTVYLYANGQPLERIVLTANTGWTATVTGLPRYDDDGNEINYVWRETAINGYVLTGTARLGNLTVLTNTRLEEYETPLGLGNVFVNVGDCFE